MTNDLSTDLEPQGSRASRARWITLLFLCLLSCVLYMDRICFSKAVPSMREELDLSKGQMFYVMLAFTIAYGAFEIPVGRWGDRRGARSVLTRIALSWSAFTALTGACGGLASLIFVRFLFGAGEAGAYPNSARVLARWLPDAERSRAQGLMLASSQIGSIIVMPMAAYLIEWSGWRTMFVVFGVVGVVWSVAFWRWFRDDPAQHPAVNAAELEHIGTGRAEQVARHDPIPWRLVRVNYSVWLLATIMSIAAGYAYFYYSWFPSYLEEARQLPNVSTGWLSMLPYVGTAIGTFVGGFIAEAIARRAADRDRALRIFCGTVYLLAAASLWCAMQCEQTTPMVVLAAGSCLLTHLTLPTWWSCAIRISGRHVGALFGLMNMVGTVGASLSQGFIAMFTEWREGLGYSIRQQWDPAFYVYMGVLVVGGVCWSSYRSQLVMEEGAEPPAESHNGVESLPPGDTLDE
jgi:sugar phosphate permease